jgi:hypothetical protein
MRHKIVSSEKKIIRLNMTDLKIIEQKVPKKYREMGGRWLTDSIVCARAPRR